MHETKLVRKGILPKGSLERLVGIKHHRVRAIQLKLENSPFAAHWKVELDKAGITQERLVTAFA